MCALEGAREREATERTGVGRTGPNPTVGSTVGTPDLSPDCVSPKSWRQQPHVTEEERKFRQEWGSLQMAADPTPSLGQALNQGRTSSALKKTKPRLPTVLGPVRDLAP